MNRVAVKYILFVTLIHGAALAMSYFIFRENKVFFLVAEAFVLASIALSWMLYNDLIRPVQLLAGGAEAIRDRDFTVKLIHTGAREMDVLVDVYNQMIDQLRSERILQQEQHYFLEKLIQTSPVGIVSTDFDGYVTGVNPAASQLMGIEEEVAKGKPLGQLPTPLAKPLETLAQGNSVVVQTESARRFKLQKAAFVDRGFPRSFVVVEELTHEILEAEKKAYGKVIRLMAHEVNNSIGAVNSILDTLSATEKDPMLAHALRVAIERNGHLNHFMRRFADVVRLPAPRPERFDLHGLLDKIVLLMSAQAREKGAELTPLYNTAAPFWITADVQQLEQVLLNVLKNALESAGQGGVVQCRTHIEQRCLEIVDDGPGIPDDVAPLLFSPFFSQKDGGQGIGLTLVKEILMQHGFGFSLRTEAPGRTVFRILFLSNG